MQNIWIGRGGGGKGRIASTHLLGCQLEGKNIFRGWVGMGVGRNEQHESVIYKITENNMSDPKHDLTLFWMFTFRGLIQY